MVAQAFIEILYPAVRRVMAGYAHNHRYAHIHRTVLKKVMVESVQHVSIYVKTQKHENLKKLVK